MYVPAPFAEDRPEELAAIMQACSLPVLISPGPGGLQATHLPLLHENGILTGHLARANPHWKNFDPAAESLAIFTAEDGYVSPEFYATKRETGKVVPTWNYRAAHAYGKLEIIEDSAELLAIVTRLTNRHEGNRPAPWAVSDAPADYIAAHLKGVVGLRLHITRLIGATKLSQNKSAADQAGVIGGLQSENPALAAQMILASKGGK